MALNAHRRKSFLLPALVLILPLFGGSVHAFDGAAGSASPFGASNLGPTAAKAPLNTAGREREVECVFWYQFRKDRRPDAHRPVMVDTIEGKECEIIGSEDANTGPGTFLDVKLSPSVPVSPPGELEDPALGHPDVGVGPLVPPPPIETTETEESAELHNSPETFTFFTNTTINSTMPTTTPVFTRTVHEPSVAVNDDVVFYTGNGPYAALSTNRGAGFNFINITAAGGLSPCCDQRVIYDPSRDLFIWLIQYNKSSTGNNLYRLAFSNTPSLLTAGPTFCSVSLTAQQMRKPNGRWLDRPTVALSNNFFYFTANIFDNAATPNFQGAVVAYIALDSLLAARSGTCPSGLNYGYFDHNRPLNLVQDARDTMYWAAIQNDSEVRIYRFPETFGQGRITGITRSVSNWNYPHSKRIASCPGPGGAVNPVTGAQVGPPQPPVDWCSRVNNPVQSGWVDAIRVNGTVGFMWNAVAKPPARPWPYIRVVRFQRGTLSRIDEPDIWNGSFAFLYPSVAANVRGDIAGTMFKGGGSFFPRLDTFIWDDFTAAYRSRTGFGWEIYFVTSSTASSPTWGDYLDTRPHSPFSRTWVGTGFTFNGTNVTPWYLWFGRERDTPEIILIP